MTNRYEEIVDSYEGARGDVLACGTGLKWVPEGKAEQLTTRLHQMGGDSAPRLLAFLEEVRQGRCEHGEVARRIGCEPRQLQRAFVELTKVIRSEFRGHGWPFGYQVVRRKHIYEMHPKVAVAFGSKESKEPEDTALLQVDLSKANSLAADSGRRGHH